MSVGGERLRSWAILVLVALVPVALALGAVLWVGHAQVARLVDDKFAGRRWDFASRIYGEEFLLYPGLDVEAASVGRRLERLRYRQVQVEPRRGGESRRTADTLQVALRPGARGRGTTRRVQLTLVGNRVGEIRDLDSGEELSAIALEPEELTGIFQGSWDKRRAIKVTDVAPILIRAILVTEDRRFFEHRGIDFRGMGRALLVNLRAGSIRQGGSTLTQQLMKNFFLSGERTIVRKLKEVAMAVVAERRYSKMQILENYLNEIYLGQRGARGIFGVAEAASFYFGKDPRDLDVADAALLAGLIRAPNGYSPFSSPNRALARRNMVLGHLLEAGEIDDATHARAIVAPLSVAAPPTESEDAPFFVEYVKRELAERLPETLLTTEGLAIHTTLDPLMQEQANRAVREGLEKLEREHPRLVREGGSDRLEAALVALAPSSGEIRALVGGRGYQESQFDRATQARRQPGSVFKPVVYLAALMAAEPERHVTAATLVEDEPFTWLYDGNREWTPRNYGDRYRGSITVRTAIEQSSNVAAARIAQAVGLDAIRTLAARMGLPEGMPAVPSIALGSSVVTPLEMTAVYASIAAGGVRATPYAIERVASRQGEELLGEKPLLSAVIPPAAAYVMTHMLEGVLDAGTGTPARSAGFARPAAGKTGTSDRERDAWFVGFTPDLVAGVWVGHDGESVLGLSGAAAALPIWTEFMRRASAADPPRPFSRPPGVSMVRVDRHSGEPVALRGARGEATEEIVEEAFLAGDEPIWAGPLDLEGAAGRGAFAGPAPSPTPTGTVLVRSPRPKSKRALGANEDRTRRR